MHTEPCARPFRVSVPLRTMRLTIPESAVPAVAERVAYDDPFEEWTLAGIHGDPLPVRVARPAGPISAVVLAAHGLTGSRRAPYIAGASRQWLSHGFAVVAPDFPLHGDRAQPGVGLEAARDPATVRQAIGDLKCVVDFVRGEVGDPPVVLVGFSMGALFGTVFTAQEPRIAALCLVVAGSNARRIRLTNPRLPPEAFEMLEAADPATYAPDVSPRPVLMLCADADEQFDRLSAFDLYDAFGPPKELSFFPGTHTHWPHPGSVYRRITGFIQEQSVSWAAQNGEPL